jgi:hypothetical protein
MGFLIKKAVQQIVTAKITLTSANLLTPGYIVDIPEYPAVKDYFWQVLSMNANIVNGSINYVGTSAIHIQSASAPDFQLRYTSNYINAATGTWAFAQISTSSAIIQFVENDKLQIHNPGTLTIGDNDLNIYITAILIAK